MTSPPPLQIRCRDLTRFEDLCIDLGIPAGAFRFHDWDDLPEPCLCRVPVLDSGRWDAGAREEHNRRCHDRTVLDGDGWHAVLCCRCVDASDAPDDVLAEVARRVAEAMRATPTNPEEELCLALAQSIDMVLDGTPIQAVNQAGRALRREMK